MTVWLRALLVVCVLLPSGAARAVALPKPDCEICHHHTCCCPEMCEHKRAALKNDCAAAQRCALSDGQEPTGLDARDGSALPQNPRLLAFFIPCLNETGEHARGFEPVLARSPVFDIHTPPPKIVS
jgi:hypothetical protein